MTFPAFLRAQVLRLGAGDIAEGTRRAAEACGRTPRTIQLWLRDEGNIGRDTETGARVLLARAKPAKTPAHAPAQA